VRTGGGEGESDPVILIRAGEGVDLVTPQNLFRNGDMLSAKDKKGGKKRRLSLLLLQKKRRRKGRGGTPRDGDKKKKEIPIRKEGEGEGNAVAFHGGLRKGKRKGERKSLFSSPLAGKKRTPSAGPMKEKLKRGRARRRRKKGGKRARRSGRAA